MTSDEDIQPAETDEAAEETTPREGGTRSVPPPSVQSEAFERGGGESTTSLDDRPIIIN